MWPGSTRISGGRAISLHHRSPDRRGVAAADRILEEQVAGEADVAVDDEREVVVGVAGSRQRLDPQAAASVGPVTTSMPKRLAELVLVLDVVGVRVRAEHGASASAPALDGRQQRLERRAASRRSTAVAALLVADDVRVRQPPRVHAPLDEHGASTLPARPTEGGAMAGLDVQGLDA